MKPKGTLAVLYIDDEETTASLEYIDDKTYASPVGVFTIESGKHANDKIAIFINGDKFKEWIF